MPGQTGDLLWLIRRRTRRSMMRKDMATRLARRRQRRPGTNSGGRSKIGAARREASRFWRANKEFSRKLSDLAESGVKEYGRGEGNFDEDAAVLAKEHGVAGFDVTFLEYLP